MKSFLILLLESYTQKNKRKGYGKNLIKHQSNLIRVEDNRNRCWCRILDNISYTLHVSKEVFENKLKTIVDNTLVPDETSFLSYYEDGDYFKPHEDNCKLTVLNWMYKEPKRFTGGNLVFPDYNKTIELESNKVIIFPSKITHAVNTTSMDEKYKGMGRWCITYFLH